MVKERFLALTRRLAPTSCIISDTAGVFLVETLTVLKEGGNLGDSSYGESSYGDVMQACTSATDYELSYDKVTQLHTQKADYEPRRDKAMESCTHGADSDPEKQDPWAVGYGFLDQYTHDATYYL